MGRSDLNKPTEVELDEMLRLLKDAPIPEPTSEIRQNLRRIVAASREYTKPDSRPAAHPYWSRCAFPSVACLAALVIVGVHYIQPPEKSVTTTFSVAHVSSTEAARNLGHDVQQLLAPPRKMGAGGRRSLRPPGLRKALSLPRSYTVELPYSNRDIANGTDATVSVGVSREELASLGFPVGDVPSDGKYLAEIALGDDGLPRSIRIPLPLRSAN